MKTNLWKWGVFGGVAIALFLLGRSCGVRSVVVKEGRVDTVYKADTFRVEVPVLKPYKVIKWMPSGVIIDTVEKHFIDPVDTAAIVEQCNATYLYSYQERIGHAVIQVDDTITQNMFLGRSITAIFDSIPIITKNTLIQQPKRVILYVGASAFGNRFSLLRGAGADVSLKVLDDKIFGIGVKYLSDNSLNSRNLYYELQVKFPVRLKRK